MSPETTQLPYAGNSTTLDKRAVYNAELPTLPTPALRSPWQGAICLQPSLAKYLQDKNINTAQTNASFDFSRGHCCCLNPFSKCLQNAVSQMA